MTCTARFLVPLVLLAASLSAHAAGLSAEVLARVKSATVFIKMPTSTGSGFYIGDELVVTNAHVVGIKLFDPRRNPNVTCVFNSGLGERERALNGTVVACDTAADLAFIKLTPLAGFSYPEPIMLKSANEIRETMEVYIFGFPFGEALSTTRGNPAITIGPGSVSSLRTDDHGQLIAIQVNGNLNPGNSGGPIVDTDGRLVAVSVATITGTQIGFSIPSEMVRLDLTGRVHSAEYVDVSNTDDQYTFTVKVRAVDPLSKLKGVSILYWTGRPDEKRPIDPQTKFPMHGAHGDTSQRRCTLRFDPAEGVWRGTLNNFVINKQHLAWCQPTITAAQGERMGPAFPVLDIQAGGSRAVASSRNSPNDRRNSTPTPQKPNPAAPFANVPDVPTVVEERDVNGQMVPHLTTKFEEFTLNPYPLRQLIAAPSGNVLYGIFDMCRGIKTFDPVTLRETGLIPLKSEPTAIWCDDYRVAAVCPEEKSIAVYTLAKSEFSTITAPNDKEVVPLRIVGRAPDKSLMSLWRNPMKSRFDVCLYQTYEPGGTQFVFKANMDWCTYVNGSSQLFAQTTFKSYPSGFPHLYKMATKEKINLSQFKLLPQPRGFNRNFLHCFVTSDGRNLVLPTQRDDNMLFGTTSFLVSTDLSRVDLQIPGAAVAEVPSRNMIVTWGGRQEPTGAMATEIHYINRVTGRPTRKITVANSGVVPMSFTSVPILPELLYIPNHELFIYRLRDRIDAKIRVVRCALPSGSAKPAAAGTPAPIPDAGQVAPGTVVATVPPALASVGKFLVYTPPFTRPANAQDVRFKLDKGIEGMLVDLQTGKVNFNPSEENLGKHTVSIIAEVDGVDVPVITWTMEVVK